MRTLWLVVLLTVFSLGVACNYAEGSVDYIRYSGGWSAADTGLTGSYSAMSTIPSVLNGQSEFYAAGSGGVDMIYHDGSSWIVDPGKLSTYGNYNAVAATLDWAMFASRSDGGLDYIYYDSGWQTQTTGIATQYNALTTLNYQTYERAFGARAGGGVDVIANDSGTFTTQTIFSTGTYNSIAGAAGNVAGTQGFSFIATKAGGGVDFAYYDSGSSSFIRTEDILSGTYTSITAVDSILNGVLEAYAARADGGIDMIYWDGSAWNADEVVGSGNYAVLAGGNADANTYSLVGVAGVVPEPMTLSFLLLGGLGMLRRKK